MKIDEELQNVNNININNLYNKIVERIEIAKRNVVLQINNEMTILYWNIGRDITENILKNQKAEYGKSVIKKLSQRLVNEYGRGYSTRNIFNMLKFYKSFNEFEILQTLSAKLSWSHFVELLQIHDKLKRDFYVVMCSYCIRK